jgi:hypothetical protein
MLTKEQCRKLSITNLRRLKAKTVENYKGKLIRVGVIDWRTGLVAGHKDEPLTGLQAKGAADTIAQIASMLLEDENL